MRDVGHARDTGLHHMAWVRRLMRHVRWRRCRHVFLVAILTYLVCCCLLMVGLQVTDGRMDLSVLHKRTYDPFRSQTERHCHMDTSTLQTRWPKPEPGRRGSSHMCTMDINLTSTDIQMEAVWDQVNVGYPGLILTVTGWVDTIQVPAWSPKPLHVIIVPHSHQDPGWISTVDDYYTSNTRQTLDLVVTILSSHPGWRFIWTEVIYLHRWWEGADTGQRDKLKRLVRSGQLEIVTGGWVMTDEATSHYAAMLNQLIDGHQWLLETLGISINNSWAIDPFGHSSTMPYLLSRSGVRNLVIQRAHFAIKRQFAANKQLEFYWKQETTDGPGIADVFCHMMPFLLYSIPYSCGPDRQVCCKFDFHKKNCYHGNKKTNLVSVNDENVAALGHELWEQLQKKSELFHSHVVLMPHGDDFRYSSEKEWKTQFSNLEKIMKYINRNSYMKTKIEFGTLNDYFEALEKDPLGPSHTQFPSLSGDFLTYSDRGDQYWSGFYTTRPFIKRMVRKLQSLLRYHGGESRDFE